jgi:cytochrome c oxidase cbb3-type subunit 3
MSPPAIAAIAETDVPEKSTSTSDAGPLMDHAYDGIREYDNPLPGWWRAIFWLSIVFAAGYWVWFHVGGWGSSDDVLYRDKLAIYNEGKEQREAADARDVSEEMLARNSADPKTNDQGKAIFAARCASCHTENGRGLIGPNLTDGFQMHGTTRMDILKTVRAGVPGTAMLAWGEQMPATDVVAVSAFVISMRNTNVAGKEPQGAPVERFAT